MSLQSVPIVPHIAYNVNIYAFANILIFYVPPCAIKQAGAEAVQSLLLFCLIISITPESHSRTAPQGTHNLHSLHELEHEQILHRGIYSKA